MRHGVGRVAGSCFGGVVGEWLLLFSAKERARADPTQQRKKHQSKHQSQHQRKHQSKHIKASIKPQTSLRVLPTCASCHMCALPTCASCTQTSMRVFPHLRVLPQTSLRVLPPARLAHLRVLPPARLARGQACAEPVSRRPGCVFLCMISVSLRPSVRVRRPDLPSPGCVAEESWRGVQDAWRATANDAYDCGLQCH